MSVPWTCKSSTLLEATQPPFYFAVPTPPLRVHTREARCQVENYIHLKEPGRSTIRERTSRAFVHVIEFHRHTSFSVCKFSTLPTNRPSYWRMDGNARKRASRFGKRNCSTADFRNVIFPLCDYFYNCMLYNKFTAPVVVTNIEWGIFLKIRPNSRLAFRRIKMTHPWCHFGIIKK